MDSDRPRLLPGLLCVAVLVAGAWPLCCHARVPAAGSPTDLAAPAERTDMQDFLPEPPPSGEPALSLVPVPQAAPPSPVAPRARGLRAAGWTLFGLGGAATGVGLVLIPLEIERMPLLTGILPLLAGGAAMVLLGRLVLSVAEERERPRPPPGP